jgi:hypothetical protein
MKRIPIKVLYLLCSLLLNSVTLNAQTDSKLFIGGGVSVNNYSLRNNYSRVNQFHRNNASFGLLVMYNYSANNWLRTGIKISGYKGPIIDDKTKFFEYLSVPIQFSIINRKARGNSVVQLLVGPQLSMLTRSGENQYTDEFYTLENSLGDIKHFGLSCDLQLLFPSDKYLHTIGVNVNLEYTPWDAGSAKDVGEYASVGISYSLLRKVK